MTTARVTVTLPTEVVEGIDRRAQNRSRFILEAVQRELRHRRREDLRRSMENPHPESRETAELGFAEWAAGLPEEDLDDLVDPAGGQAVCWTPDKGWREAE